MAQSWLHQSCAPLAGKELRAVMYDANMQPVDTAVVTTDPFGRVSGRFAIPMDGLTGDFAIRFTLTDKG